MTALSAAGAAAVWARPQALPSPKGPVLLTIDGRIGRTNHTDGARFDRAMIEALPQQSLTTHSPWYDRPVTFTGPLLATVIEHVLGQGQRLRATAINDYHITIPMEDLRRWDVVMAHRIDGMPIPVRNKGPLFVVYPYDRSATLRSSVYYERSIWQLKGLTVE